MVASGPSKDGDDVGGGVEGGRRRRKRRDGGGVDSVAYRSLPVMIDLSHRSTVTFHNRIVAR